MSIRSKIQALITAANTKTGESDTTLTDAVQTLVDGYGQGGGVTTQPLSVTENGTYTAPSGTAYTPVTVNVPTGGQKWTTDVNAVAGTPFLTNNNLITVAIPASTNFYVKVTGANIIDSSGLNGVYAWREDGTKPGKYNIKPDGEVPVFFTDDAVVGISFYCVAARVIGTGTLTLEVGVI